MRVNLTNIIPGTYDPSALRQFAKLIEQSFDRIAIDDIISSLASATADRIQRAAAGGTVDAITATFSPALTLTDKIMCAVISAGANTSTTPTFAPDGLTAHTIMTRGGGALVAGSIGAAGFVALLEYNLASTRWELLNPATNANLTGPITSDGNATAVAAQTGTGTTFVMDTSPTLVTPALGTPSAVVLTNATGTASGLTAGNVTTNANLTGPITSTGNATAVASQTGTGSVFAMQASPSFTTAVLGDATMAVFNTVSTTVNAFGAATTLNVGNASGTNTILGDTRFSQDISVGIAPSSVASVYAARASTNTSATEFGGYFQNLARNTSGAVSKIGIAGYALTDTGWAGTGGSVMLGMQGIAAHTVTGTLAAARSFQTSLSNTSTGTITSATGFLVNDATNSGGGTITTLYGVFINDLTAGATNRGFHGNVSSGTNKWNLYMGGTAPNYLAGTLLVGTTTETASGGLIQLATGTTAASGILAGTDTNLYRSAANTWKTDDSLLIVGTLGVTGQITGTTIKLTTGAAINYVLTSDANGVGSWQVLASGMTYKGVWDASTNTPTLADGTGTTGDTYAVTVGAVRNLGSGNQTFVTGGWCIYNGTIWNAVGTSAAVTSVNGLTGAVSLSLASSAFVNQGTTTTVLHGNAAGNPSWAAVSLTADVSGTLPVANGGTGITALGTGVATALGVNVGSAGAFVTFDGALGTPASGVVTNLTGTFPAGIDVTSKTGTGTTFVMNTSPTLVTPALGTPSAVVLTNATGTAAGLTAGTVTTNANLTGPITSTGNATSVAAQTGTGSVFAMQASPAFTTAVLGDATMAVFNTVSTTVNAFGAATTLNIGNASGTNTISGATRFNQSVGIGVAPSSTIPLGISTSITATSGSPITFNLATTNNAASPSTANIFGIVADASHASSSSLTGLNGLFSRIQTISGGTGAVASGRAFYARIDLNATAAFTTLSSYETLTTLDAASTITDLFGFRSGVVSNAGVATVTQHTVFDTNTQSVGTTIYGFRGQIGAAANRWNLYMSGTAPNYLAGTLLVGTATETASGGLIQLATGTSPAAGILAGTDTNLYRSAANTWKTDDALIVTGALTATAVRGTLTYTPHFYTDPGELIVQETSSSGTAALSYGWNRLALWNFDLSKIDNYDKTGISMNIVNTSSAGQRNVTGIQIAGYMLPDNGGDVSNILSVQTGGGGAGTFYKVSLLRPAGYTDQKSSPQGALEVATTDESFAGLFTSGSQTWGAHTNASQAVWARIANAQSKGILIDPENGTFDTREALAIGRFALGASASTSKTFSVTLAGKGYFNSTLLVGTATETASSGLIQLGTGTTAAFGILAGTDTNLYRAGADTWKTDDSLVIAGGLNVATLPAYVAGDRYVTVPAAGGVFHLSAIGPGS